MSESPNGTNAAKPRGTRTDADGKVRYTPTGPAPKRGAVAPGSTQLTALPSPLARGLAFASILFGGLLGALIGFGLVRVGDPKASATGKALGAAIGAVLVAAGTAVLAVLVLRAMGEWRRVSPTPGPVRLGDRARQ